MAVATREAPSAPPAGAPRERRPWVDSLVIKTLAVVAAFLFTGLVGAVIILLYGESPLYVYSTIWQFSTSRVSDFARVLEQATPLIFSGLAVAVAFKCGLFNIGVEGQYIVGMMTATMAAVWVDLPAPIHLPLVVLASVAGSMVWAFVPAILKVRTGAHEVVTTIMMNGIAISLVAWALLNPLRTSDTGFVDLRSDRFPESAIMPPLAPALGLEEQIPPSAHLTWLFPLALLACVGVWFLLYRTRLGYEARAVGASPGSAEAGGVSIGATQLGFTGIAVAFLGRNNPFGIVLAALLFGILFRGEDGVAIATDLPREITVILEGLLILSVVVAYQIARRVLLRRQAEVLRAEEEGGARAAA
jgi:general nucleoside transport system permease protein